MKYTTKNQRLIAICDAYCAATGETSYTTESVAKFALQHKLYPVPVKHDPAWFCQAWEAKLDVARKVVKQ